jgi:hypothetical protein
VGFHRAKIRPPVLDRLAHEGGELTRHEVNPPCSPRALLRPPLVKKDQS